MDNLAEPKSLFLRACHRLPVERTPVWFMRQAGRYMAEYRAIRSQHSMLTVINTPELAAEVTLQPIRAFGFDAAIIFADILPPLIGMGLSLDFVPGKGPVIGNPIASTDDIDVLTTPSAEETLAPTLEAIKLVVGELGETPLIGFAGAPFTLASYAIEGGSTKTFAKTKALMYREPAAWEQLMGKLVDVQADYLLAQAEAGAQALQLFDSWAGALGREDYVRYIRPYNRELFARLASANVPVINFSTRTSAYLDVVASCGGDVIGVDWQLPLDEAWARVGYDKAIQGNLDSAALLAPWEVLKEKVDAVFAQANGRPGHIFNLGHGIFPNTPVDTVARVVAYIREKGA